MNEHCTFCRIVRGEEPTNVVYEDELVVAFHDIHPSAPVHVFIVPRRHIRSVNDLTEKDKEIIAELGNAAIVIARKESVPESGYKLICNVERGGGQFIFHLHLHLLGGW